MPLIESLPNEQCSLDTLGMEAFDGADRVVRGSHSEINTKQLGVLFIIEQQR